MRGGKRAGAGRKPGTRNPATLAADATIGELARQFTSEAIHGLVAIARSPKLSASARVSAWSTVIERGHGKAPQLNTSDVAQLRRALDMSDDELAAVIAGGRSNGAAKASADQTQLH